jgi:hypothetical protein
VDLRFAAMAAAAYLIRSGSSLRPGLFCTRRRWRNGLPLQTPELAVDFPRELFRFTAYPVEIREHPLEARFAVAACLVRHQRRVLSEIVLSGAS